MTQRKPKPWPSKRKNPPSSSPAPGGSGGGGQGWLYGSHAVLAALENPARVVERLCLTPEAHEALGHRLDRLMKSRPRLMPEKADRATLAALLPAQAVHQGIAAKVQPLPEPDLWTACEAPGPARVLILDQVTDPHNVGAILRSAAAFDARAVVLTDRHAPDATATLAKAASGALEIVPLVRVTNLARALDDLAEMGYWRLGLAGEAPETLDAAAKGLDRVALVLGAEGEGLRRLTRERCDKLARLPISPRMESLNVSNAAAVALYELGRGA